MKRRTRPQDSAETATPARPSHRSCPATRQVRAAASSRSLARGGRAARCAVGVPFALILAALCFAVPACNGGAPEGPTGGEEKRDAEPSTPTPPVSSDGGTLKELERKLKPPPGPTEGPAPAPSDPKEVAKTEPTQAPTAPETDNPAAREKVEVPKSELLEKAESFAASLAKSIEDGDREKTLRHLISAEELDDLVESGHLPTLKGMLVPANVKALETLMQTVRDTGKTVEANFTPGTLSVTHQTVFRKDMPTMNDASLELKVDGVPVPVRLDQLLWVDDGWKVFRLSL